MEDTLSSFKDALEKFLDIYEEIKKEEVDKEDSKEEVSSVDVKNDEDIEEIDLPS